MWLNHNSLNNNSSLNKSELLPLLMWTNPSLWLKFIKIRLLQIQFIPKIMAAQLTQIIESLLMLK